MEGAKVVMVMRSWTILLLSIMIGSALISGAGAYTWSYTPTNASSPWVCPAGTTSVYVQAIGGGSSGAGSWTLIGGWSKAGYGGNAGEVKTFIYDVTPGISYTYTVGAGGTTGAASTGLTATPGNAGGLTTIFGTTAAGGASVSTIPGAAVNGTNGASGYVVATKLTADGGSAAPNVGGTGGNGYGAAGGGASADITNGATTGGAGAPGLLTISNASGTLNSPNFTADDELIPYGSVVHFTDTSIINEPTNLAYYWVFGDGTTSNNTGSVSHVFAYMGSFDISLSITSTSGTITRTKYSYINVITQPQEEIDLASEPKPVQFHVQTFLGAPLVNANVTIQGIQTSTGNWDWIPLLLGIPLDEVALGNTSMSQTTDSLGNVEFLLVPSVKYNTSVVLHGYSFQPFYVIPHEERYTLSAILNASEYFGVPAGKSNITVTVSGTKINSTHGRVNLSLIDTASSVTGGRVSIYKKNATPGGDDVYITSMQISGSSYVNNSTVLSLDNLGTEFIVHADAGSSLESANITIDKIVSFMANPVQVGWFTAQLTLWFAMGILILVALSSGASGSPQVMAVDCILAWLFYGIGWLNPIVDSYGNTAVIGTLSLALFMVVVWLFAEGKRAER